MKTFCIVIPVAGGENLSGDPRFEGLAAQSDTNWKAIVVPESGTTTLPASLDSRYSLAAQPASTFAGLLEVGLSQGADYVLPLAPGVILKPNALEKFAAAFEADPAVGCLFSSFEERQADGSTTPVHLFDHEGAPHERFDFGYLKVWRAEAIRSIGGVRNDLVHAAEYDLELKIADHGKLKLIDEILYTVKMDHPAEKSTSALHSPGKGKLGGFSYIFYPEDLEREITTVFEDMLRRRDAYIDHPTVNVPYPVTPYPILASVIIPVLNRSRYIGNAIDRVLEGTFQDFEILVIDNGSTDGTQAVVEKYAAADPRVKLLTGHGSSIASALNEGIRAAHGKYICQLDSDDEYTPDTLEKMIGHMESHPRCGLAISYYELMDENRNQVKDIDPVTHSGYTRNQILRRDGAGALRVFPKVVLEEMRYYDEYHYGNFGEDYDMVLKTGEKYDVDRVHNVLYRYRRHSDNTDVTRDPLMKVRNKNNARLDALRRRTTLNAERKNA